VHSGACQQLTLSLLTRVLHSSGVSQHTVGRTLAECNLLRGFVPTSRGPKPAALNLTCLATQFVVLFQQFSQWEMEGADLQGVVQ
jgi:hypothetical protein